MSGTSKPYFRSLLIIIISAFLIVGCNRHKQPSEAAITACNGDPYLAKFGCSVDQVQQAASKGDPDAQYALGYMYYYGVGTVQDTETAKLWIARAAAQGQPLAKKAVHMLNQSGSAPTTLAVKKAKPTISSHMPNYGSGISKRPVISALRRREKVTESSDHTVPTTRATTKHASAPRSTEERADHYINTSARNRHPALHKVRGIGRSAISSMEAKLMHMPRNAYTLQLMGNHNLSTIEHYIAKHHLNTRRARYYQANFQSKPWYMLTYGEYKSVAEAHKAIRELPKSVRANHPWIKPMRDVQAEIRTRQMVS